jgi:Ser/Thr protein kinase RdoA (MazF antagonist)
MSHEANARSDSLNEVPPSCSTQFATDFVHRVYGIDGRARQLACERDQIFAIDTGTEEGFVLRLTNPAEDRQVTNFQTEAMCHLNKVNPDLPVPRVVLDKADEAEIKVILPDGRISIARMITLLPGIPLASAPERNPGLRSSMADAIANLGLAFSGFFHPGANHELLWDMQHALKLRKLVVYLQDKYICDLVERGLDAFERNIAPIQSNLRAQVIHNDFNFSNVMIDNKRAEITGILDFGDMVHAPLIYDLAVALAYQFSGDNDDALGVIEAFTFRYHQIVPLQRQELEILYYLITTRQILSLLITQWRASVYPENRQYILRNNASSEMGIKRLAALNSDRVAQVLVRTCLNQ